MKPEVLPAFLALTRQHEGRCDWFYLDVKGLVTIGEGDLADPIGRALHIEFVHPDGSGVAWPDVVAAWTKVKTKQEWRKIGGGQKAWQDLTSIRATSASLDRLVLSTLSAFEAVLHGIFPEWDAWPWRAQVATLSMAWANGPHLDLEWPRFTAACRARAWATAAIECQPSPTEMAAQNPSFEERVAEQKRLFTEAAAEAAAEGGTVYIEPVEEPMTKPKNGQNA